MGQSTPTTTMAFDTFEARYAEFRAELHPKEQDLFDELVCGARRHSNAINRRPHLDFERPVMLTMLMEVMRRLRDEEARHSETRKQLDEVCRILAEMGKMRRRIAAMDPWEMGRCGQRRLSVK